MNKKNKFPVKWRKVANNSLSIFGLVFFLFFVFKISQKSYHLKYYGRETNAKIDSVYENWRYQKKSHILLKLMIGYIPAVLGMMKKSNQKLGIVSE